MYWLLLNKFAAMLFPELIEQQKYKSEDLVKLLTGI